MTDIIAVGEVLIDLTQTGTNEAGIPVLAANPGGAPANVCVAVSRLGGSSAFIGKVGDDSFGHFLNEVLKKNAVGTDGLCSGSGATTMAIVSVDTNGERSFRFLRGADAELSAQDIDAGSIAQAKIFHFGSISLIAEPARSATIFALETARKTGTWVSYDPNYRAALWPDQQTAVEQMRAPLPYVDIIKLSEEELPLLTGEEDLERGSAILKENGISLTLITRGEKGAFYRLGDVCGQLPGIATEVADTNGAGDTFLGAILYQLCRRGIESLAGLSVPELEEMIAFANRAAAITCSRSGAIPAMPTLQEVTARYPEIL